MEEDNAQPVVDESQTQELQEEAVEAPEVDTDESQHETDENQPLEEEAVQPEASEPETQQEEEVEPEEEEGFNPSQLESLQGPAVQTVEIQQYIDEEGNFDAIGYNSAMQQQIAAQTQAAVQQAVATTQMQQSYDKEWNKALDKYPELKKDRELRDMVQDIHANSAMPGRKYLSPAKAAEKIFGIRSSAKAEGMKAAQQTRQVQAAANLGSPNPPAAEGTTDKSASLKETMKSGATRKIREAATRDYLSQMMQQGKF